MTLDQFAEYTELLRLTEIDKVRLIAFYFSQVEEQKEFGSEDIKAWFDSLGLPRPNMSRLMRRIREDKSFVRGSTHECYRIHPIALETLKAKYPRIRRDTEEVVCDDTILPRPIYENTRGFIESLAKQINASYEYNIFDGCAVLMRRLLEVLLILAYENHNMESDIKTKAGDYLPLEQIVNHARSGKGLNLSRDTKAVLDEFRTLGNFSAHKVHYNCRRGDLQRVAIAYRAAIEELLYKAGIRV